jgi:hypothetical protein
MKEVVLQVIIGLLIVAAIHMLSVSIMRTDQIGMTGGTTTSGSQQATQTVVLDGLVDTPSLVYRSFNTVDESSPNFVSMPRSINRKGGAQFTYAFWIHMGAASLNAYRHKTLLVKGDAQPYMLRQVALTKVGDTVQETPVATTFDDPVVYCPMLRFGKDHTELEVWFNSLTNLREHVVFSTVVSSDHALRKNMPSLVTNKWALFTVVLEDHAPINDFEDGIQVKLYINNAIHQVMKVPGTLRQNNGNLILFPNGGIQGCKIGNLTYFNYALEQPDVQSLFMKGPPKTYYSGGARQSAMQPLQLSAYNKIDLYNF